MVKGNGNSQVLQGEMNEAADDRQPGEPLSSPTLCVFPICEL